MGEEAKQEQAQNNEVKNEKKVVEEKKEENPPPPPKEEEKKEDEKPKSEAETPAEEPPQQPPPPLVLYVDLHCVGCAKKIERTIMKFKGVEEVAIDMGKNQVTIKGVMEAQAICNMIMKKIKRNAKVLSPLPTNQTDPIPDLPTSQVSGLTSVELNVNMHCEACAGQLKKKILKMKGVQTAETEFSSGKVTVTGTMDPNTLVDYVYKRTKKQARIIPQPEPEKPPEESKPEEVKDPEKPTKDPKSEGGENPPEEPPKDGENGEGDGKGDDMVMDSINLEEESMKRMMYNYNYNHNYNYNYIPNCFNNYQPLYVIEKIPPPQLFSDENPNACCIS